ncbi:MAG: hypothetical protein K2M82_00050 [Lachnospiraceae bacterium]|nr:hypothetical protein [Lachnospiraceae bacterium]
MLIRTQSREGIAEVTHIYLSDMIGEKSYYIFGTCTPQGAFSGSKLTLGIYPNKEAALKELDKIDSFFCDNPNGLYRMT